MCHILVPGSSPAYNIVFRDVLGKTSPRPPSSPGSRLLVAGYDMTTTSKTSDGEGFLANEAASSYDGVEMLPAINQQGVGLGNHGTHVSS